jgi:hypothetical protein
VVINPRRAAGSTVGSDGLRLVRCTEDKNLMNTYKNLLPTLDSGSHGNAAYQLRRALRAVGCRRLILIEILCR